MNDDAQLLRRYAQDRSDQAFAELVQRHLGLVYNSALRLLDGNAHHAQDVAQAVFTDLARKAGRLSRHTSLTGWLYTSTRFSAAKMIRSQQRRQIHEREAQTQQDLMRPATSEADWIRLRPVLDAVLGELSLPDREAILLRFFEGRPFADVGGALRLTEDAARMRVSRALERMRVRLDRRGITSTTAALSLVLGCQVSMAAPPGLAAAVTGSALSAAGAAGIASLSILQFMSTTKVVVGICCVAVLAAGWRQATTIQRQRVQIAVLEKRTDDLLRQVRQLHSAQQQALAEAARQEVAKATSDSPDPAQAWLIRVKQLRERFEAMPGQKIPEMQLLTDEDWLGAAKGKLDTETDYRRAMADLRNTAEHKFAGKLMPALRKYSQLNDGQFPTDLSQLQTYLNDPVLNSMLGHYAIKPASAASNVRNGGTTIITETGPIDEEYDTQMVIGPNGYGSRDYATAASVDAIAKASKAYAAANDGKKLGGAQDLSLLLPYAATPKQQAAIQKAIDRYNELVSGGSNDSGK